MIKEIFSKTAAYIERIEKIIDDKDNKKISPNNNLKTDPFSILTGDVSQDILDSIEQSKSNLELNSKMKEI